MESVNKSSQRSASKIRQKMMKSKFIEIFTVIFAIVGYIGCESLPNNSQPLFCTDLKPQIDVDIDQVRYFLFFFLLIEFD